ncbi:hypothetical protein [Sedimenticola sp.]|uniref:hypothetical protein n=1 Tax=Sedimenticola sp. TaxID=1940285 RepID=UPI003D138782
MWEFEVVNLVRTQAPIANHKGNWYRYTIANRVTEITGTRRGSKDEVMNFLNSSLQRLNNRHKGPAFSNS